MDNERIIPPIENSRKKYKHHIHRMQAGVEYIMQKEKKETTPKQLRVGVNSAMVEHSALSALLISKGLIDLDEYASALADQAEQEADAYEERVQKLYGPQVKLGSLYPNEEF